MSVPPDLTPREAAERWLAQRRIDASESTISSYWYRLKLFIEWYDAEHDGSLADLSPWLVDSYLTHRQQKGVAATTLNNEMKTLRSWLEYCESIGLVEDVAEHVRVPPIPDGEESRDTRLDSEQAIGLLRAFRAGDQFATRRHALLELAWVTGARVGGLRALDVRDFDRDDAYVRFHHRPETETPLKNGPDGERYVGLPETVATVVADYADGPDRYTRRDDHGRQPLLNGEQGRPVPGTIREWIYLATVPCWYRACPHDKVPATCEYKSYHGASGCPSSRSSHEVRTGAITWMLSRGIPVERVAERVNATVAVIQRHYDKLTAREEFERRRRQWVDRLDIDEEENEHNNGDTL